MLGTTHPVRVQLSERWIDHTRVVPADGNTAAALLKMVGKIERGLDSIDVVQTLLLGDFFRKNSLRSFLRFGDNRLNLLDEHRHILRK